MEVLNKALFSLRTKEDFNFKTSLWFTLFFDLKLWFPLQDAKVLRIIFLSVGNCLLIAALASLGYEKTCVLFNCGALASQIAAEQNLDNDEGLKAAAKHYQVQRLPAYAFEFCYWS